MLKKLNAARSQAASKTLALVAVAPALLASAAAHAAVPAGAEAIFTGMATDFGVIQGYGFTAMAVIVGGLIVFKLIKKVANKSS